MTRIIIAHRPQTISSADRIVAFTEGRLSHVQGPMAGIGGTTV